MDAQSGGGTPQNQVVAALAYLLGLVTGIIFLYLEPYDKDEFVRFVGLNNYLTRLPHDQEILDAKAKVGAGGLGCEPASAASVAGARKLRQEGVICKDERTVCILTGHQLKDPTATVAYHTTDQAKFNEVLGRRGVKRAAFANRAVEVANDLEEIVRAIQLYS